MIFDMKNLVRFVDTSGNTLFYAKNGERIIRFGADGKEEARLVVEGFGETWKQCISQYAAGREYEASGRILETGALPD